MTPRTAFALAIAAALALLTPERARADTDSGSPVAIGLGLGGAVPAGGMIIVAALTSKAVYPERAYGYMVALYTTGALGLGLGGAAIAIQATRPGSCGDNCQGAYGAGGTAMGLGALAVLFGGFATMDVMRQRRGLPIGAVPILIRTEHGTAFGAGVAGLTF